MHEDVFSKHLKELGFNLYHNGWPDFAIKSPNGRVLLIEHKSVRDKPKRNQLELHELLKELGLTIHVVRSVEEVIELSGMDELKPKLVQEDLKESNLPEEVDDVSYGLWLDEFVKRWGGKPSDFLPKE